MALTAPKRGSDAEESSESRQPPREIVRAQPATAMLARCTVVRHSDCPGRLLVLLAGRAPLLLAGTGALIWWRKRSVRRSIAARHAASAAPGVPSTPML